MITQASAPCILAKKPKNNSPTLNSVCQARKKEKPLKEQTKTRKQKLFINLQKSKYLGLFRQLNDTNALWWLSRQKRRQFLDSLQVSGRDRTTFVSYDLENINFELKHV